ncbi:DUF6894 family protein [Lichenibacterium dinghuense]|uniref:DUF6894 family protein n=1 Tax=Lichenibacterium dinghuense TaxID=2895977 RepID=UPI001F323021|nr:hypothetical protein [Lichenibacterium sp. 6Y81]
MPRFHFCVHNGREALDEEGIDLPDVRTARTEAVRLAGGMLLDQASLVHDDGAWYLSVTDGYGRPLVRVDVNVVDLLTVQ